MNSSREKSSTKNFCQVIYYSLLLCGQSVAPQEAHMYAASGHSGEKFLTLRKAAIQTLIQENLFTDRLPFHFAQSSPYLSMKARASQSLAQKVRASSESLCFLPGVSNLPSAI